MSRYYFNLTDGRPFNDLAGVDLPDLAAAREYGAGFACDLMRRGRALDWSEWKVFVSDERKCQVLAMTFNEVRQNADLAPLPFRQSKSRHSPT
jgi:hypothetical protein